MKLYREVKASERLPDEDGKYNTRTENGLHYDLFVHSNEYHMWEDGEIELYWLEEIEITEEDIIEEIYYDDDSYYKAAEAAKRILSKLSGQ